MSLCIGLDVETHSPVDLPRTGASVYARDPRTDCLLLSYKITGGNAPVSRWRKGEPPPDDLMHYARTGAHFSGWNVIGFDRLIWRHILVARYGFEPIDDDRWLDSMHRAASANLPRSLDGAASAVGMPFQKNLKDSNRIRRITNANRTPVPSADDIAWLADRCDQDVLMEEGVLLRLPPWPQVEPWNRMPEIDRAINDRGVLVDLDLIRGMAKAASTEGTRLSKAMSALTDGEVKATTNVEQLKNWLVTRGVVLPLVTDAEDEEDNDDEEATETEKKSRWRLRKSDVADLLARDDIPEICRQALLIRAEAAKASVRKLNSMIAGADTDGRIRGAHILMGAQQTARFSGVRVQVQNLIRDAFGNEDEVADVNKLSAKKNKKEVHALAEACLTTAIQVGRSGDADIIRLMYERQRKDSQGRVYTETVMHWISRMLRRVICAPEGYTLLNGDFAQIEARIPNWLAGQWDVVEAFAQGKDVYRMQAAPIYNVKPEELTHEQRQMGKVQTLFLGFAGGENAFIPAAMNYGLSIAVPVAQNIVKIFRERNSFLAAYWDELLWCAIQAVMSPGCVFSVKPTHLISWCMEGDCLLARLPSGRCLRYWQPRLEQGYWKDGKPKPMPDLTVLQVKGRAVLRRTLWRGLTIENCLTADTKVITLQGVKRLVDVALGDRLWDGGAWVAHEGVVFKGLKRTIDFGGVRVTPDHKVYLGGEQRECGRTSFNAAARAYARYYRAPDWPTGGGRACGIERAQADRVENTLRLRHREVDATAPFLVRWGEKLRMPRARAQESAKAIRNNAQHVEAPCVLGLARYARPLHVANAQSMGELRGAWDTGLSRVGCEFSSLLGRHGRDVPAWLDAGQSRQQRPLLRAELSMDELQNTGAQHTVQHLRRNAVGRNNGGRGGRAQRHQRDYAAVSGGKRVAIAFSTCAARRHEPVYDIVNAGPNHRFTVVGQDGRLVLVSNCTQAIAADMLVTALANMHDAGLPVVLHVHDAAAVEVRERDAEKLMPLFEQCMLSQHAWTAGLPVAVAAHASTRFG